MIYIQINLVHLQNSYHILNLMLVYLITFSEEGIDFDTFLKIDKDTLKEVVPQIGPRIRLLSFIKRTNEESSSTASTVLLNTSGSSQAELQISSSPRAEKQTPNKKIRLDNDPLLFPNQQNLFEYLKSSRVGKQLLNLYSTNKSFTAAERNHLVHLISDALCEANERVTNANFGCVADRLIELFPTELKSSYFIPPEGAKRISTGKLVDRFRNQRKLFGSLNKSNHEANDSYTSDDCETQRREACEKELEWLLHSAEPWHRVISAWNKTSKIRNCGDSIHNYFKKFPALRCSLGYNLVS